MEITQKTPKATLKWAVSISDIKNEEYFIFGSFKTKKEAERCCKRLNKSLPNCKNEVIKFT